MNWAMYTAIWYHIFVQEPIDSIQTVYSDFGCLFKRGRLVMANWNGKGRRGQAHDSQLSDPCLMVPAPAPLFNSIV